MREDLQLAMTLAIAGSPIYVDIVGIKGRDRLNAPFSYDIDVVSPDPALAGTTLRQRSAYLQWGCNAEHMQGVQGRIQEVQALYRGLNLSLYRLRLVPAHVQLDAMPHRRVFNGQSVPQIITTLLQSNRTPDAGVTFVHLNGIYPPREHCLQYDESDVHFIARLCEEEGISYRFRHTADRHEWVFSDDPASFPEWPFSLTVEHLAERFSARNCYSSHQGEHYAPSASGLPVSSNTGAVNQTLDIPYAHSASPQWQQQIRGRLLERLRCERRDVLGSSTHPWLRSGLVVRVEDHPEAVFNNQWLLTDVSHTAWQLAPLRNCPSRDVIQILRAMTPDGTEQGATGLLDPGPDGRPALNHYQNRFRVIPWEMPYRPALKHPKPVITQPSAVTLMTAQPDTAGRLRIRYEWQSDRARDSHARFVSSLEGLRPGARVMAGFFQGDPDQPVIYDVAEGSDPPSEPRNAAVTPPQNLCLESRNSLMLKGPRATLSIAEDSIHYTEHGSSPISDA